MNNIQNFQSGRMLKGLVIGAIWAFAFTSAYLLYKKKTSRNNGPSLLNDIEHDNNNYFNMERFIFTIPGVSGDIQATVEQSGGCYLVHLNGEYIGNMWRDEDKGLQWNTKDEKLEPYVWEIARNISEAFSRKGFSSLLMGTYPEIIATHWKGSETLEVIIDSNTDIEVFSTFLKDEVMNLVDFEEHLDLLVKKEEEAYFVMVGVN